jgi:hypothetical protein
LGNKFDVDISGIAEGTYMMEFQLEDGSIVTSIVVVNR